VAKDLFHVEDISGFAVFHGSFPVAKSMEGDLFDSSICFYRFFVIEVSAKSEKST
jgi:hypothetical protein